MAYFLRPSDEESHKAFDQHLFYAALPSDVDRRRTNPFEDGFPVSLYLYEPDGTAQPTASAGQYR